MDNNDPVDLAAHLGIPELRFFGEVVYGGGGGPVGSVLQREKRGQANNTSRIERSQI